MSAVPPAPAEPPLHVEAVIGQGLARRAAFIVQRDRFFRPITTTLLAIELAVAVVFFVVGPIWAGVLLAVVGAVGPLAAYLTLPKLSAHLEATGFAPGTALAVDYLPEQFVLSTGGSSNALAYAEIQKLRITRSLAVLRRRGEKVLFLLPVEAVPPQARPLFGPAYRGAP
jgi:hypothetical protein